MGTPEGASAPDGAASVRKLTKRVGRALVRAAGPDWTHIRAEYRSVGRHIEVDLLVSGPDGAPRMVRPPLEAVEGLGQIRAAMYRQDEGTWLGAIYEISPDGSFTWDCEPNVEPVWRRIPPPIGFQDELRTHPRTDPHIPDWLRARAGLPPRAPEQAAPAPALPTGPVPVAGGAAAPPVPHNPGPPAAPQPGPQAQPGSRPSPQAQPGPQAQQSPPGHAHPGPPGSHPAQQPQANPPFPGQQRARHRGRTPIPPRQPGGWDQPQH